MAGGWPGRPGFAEAPAQARFTTVTERSQPQGPDRTSVWGNMVILAQPGGRQRVAGALRLCGSPRPSQVRNGSGAFATPQRPDRTSVWGNLVLLGQPGGRRGCSRRRFHQLRAANVTDRFFPEPPKTLSLTVGARKLKVKLPRHQINRITPAPQPFPRAVRQPSAAVCEPYPAGLQIPRGIPE